MDTTAAGAAATRGGVSLPLSSSSQPSRKEWRVVSEQMVRNSANEEVERSKIGQSDERLIYEVQHGRESINMDFRSITIDRGLDNNVLQQRLQTVAKQRVELQHIEIELRGQLFASSKILELQNTYDAQIHEHVNVNIKLQEQLHELEQNLRELERKIEEKERELHAIRLDNEAAWAKEDLIREQSKELQSYRRERENSEAERVQHIKQIHDLQEHFQEKEQQFLELQDQHRIAQDAIIFKDEQLREAQAWMTRAREMDALQSTTNHTLHAELHERTEQCNQLWIGCQRQFGEMERLHLHIQQLQLELADARERSGSYSDGPQVSQTNSKDVSIGRNKGGQLEGKGLPSENSGSVLNGNSENVLSLASGGHSSTLTDHVHGVPFSPSLIGMPTFLPPGQMAALRPFVIHQQGLPHSVQLQGTQSPFHSVPAISTIQQWQQHQPDNQHAPVHQHQQTQENSVGTESNGYCQVSENEQTLNSSYLDNNINQELLPGSVVLSPNEEAQVLNSVDKSYDSVQSQQNLLQVSSQFHDSLRLDPIENNNANKEKSINSVIDNGVENKNPGMELLNPSISASSSEASTPVNFIETTNTPLVSVLTNGIVSTGQKTDVVGKTGEHFLLDERSLLACIVRTIGSGGRIRISSTLPNRLGKMLGPLHWHDYKKQYGKLDDFVASHPELFVIEGDFIQLREGAQEIIAATAAVAKVAAAAAAAPSSYSSFLPSVTVTPMAQSHRLKKIYSFDSSPVNVDKSNLNSSHLLVTPSQNLNGASFNISGGISNVKILSKPKDRVERNDSESKLGRSVQVENGTNSDKNDFFQSKGVSQARHGTSRAIGAASNPRR
ncbi:uncharacterized protein LOC142540344 isoform X4 [Primulina tabacum]|uniref:uncharacterized protein LOC142540344 isoform X4 n=1 Tax=Primulina tabacum TaxID=48773 RepID=UPI003F592542